MFAGSDITQIMIPRTVKTIEAYAFAFCEKLRSVRFEKGSMLEAIGDKAFIGSGIQNFFAPPELQTLGAQVF